MHKRRDFLAGSISLLLSSSLTRSRRPTSSASVQKKENGGHRSSFFVGGPNASDTNPGTAAAPFATIQAAANVATPGSEVRIRDGIYRETVTPANSGTKESPIIFTADTRPDSTLSEPVVSGADLLTTSWTLASHVNLPGVHPVTKPIYETSISLPTVEYLDHDISEGRNTTLMAQQIFVRSKAMQEARWPKVPVEHFAHPMKDHNHARQCFFEDKGTTWDYSVVGGNIVLTDSTLPAVPGGLAGAYLTALYWFVPGCAPILSSGPQTLTCSGAMPGFSDNFMIGRFNGALKDWTESGATKPDYQKDRIIYYIRGALGLLTSEGEFFYDQGAGKLYLWAPGGAPPSNVEYKARNYGFDLTGKSHIHLKHLNFFACDIPTNGDCLWPTNAKEWPMEQPVPAQYTDTERPVYPTVAAKGAAENFEPGAFPWAKARDGTAIVPDPANGILIDYCRFKYLNHQTVMVGIGDTTTDLNAMNRAMRVHSEVGLQHGNSNSNFGNMHRCGIRLTGDNCKVSNSVLDTAAGSMIMVTGKNCTIENNYLKDANYIGNWSSAIGAGIVANGLRVYGNTMWRSGRTLLWNLHSADVSFNDWSEWSYLSIDGGGSYANGKHMWGPPSRDWNDDSRAFYIGENLLGRRERPADSIHFNSYTMAGSNWHHNWGHDARSFPGRHVAGASIYFDGSTDGAVIHNNVSWGCQGSDLQIPNDQVGTPPIYANTPLGYHWVFNNTLATPRDEVDGVQRGVGWNQLPDGHPDQVGPDQYTQNNIARHGLGMENGGPDSNVNHAAGTADGTWIDKMGAYGSTPANGKPWLIGFEPGQYPCGLGFVPSSGSPALDGRAVVVSALRYPPNDVNTELRNQPFMDALGRPMDYVDDPVAPGKVRAAGAYQIDSHLAPVPGAPRYYSNPGHPAHGAWIPGTTLPREFIEGQPWEQQWA